jgi:hypothetical protein
VRWAIAAKLLVTDRVYSNAMLLKCVVDESG